MNCRISNIVIIYVCFALLNPLGIMARQRKKAGMSPAAWGVIEPDRLPQKPKAARPFLQSEALNHQGMRFRKNASYRSSGVEGIDVSHYQGNIDWKRVAQAGNISYVYIKCSEGASIKDEFYRRNVEGAQKEGIPVGVYHFYRPSTSVGEQLANMTSIALKADMKLIPIIDIEHRGSESKQQFVSKLRSFVQAVAEHYGCEPMLYTGQNFYNKYLAGELPEYRWMIAKYQEEPPVLTDENSYEFWQFTAKARVPGIRGYVDRSCLMEGFSLKDIKI